MQIGSEAQATVDSGSPVLGPIRIEFGEGPIPEEYEFQTVPFQGKDYSEKIDLLIEKMATAIDILEDIRYFSVPWYLRLLNWLKEKNLWHGKQKAG